MSLDPHYAREDPFAPSADGRYFIAFPTHERTLAAMIAGVHSTSPLQTLISHTGLGKTSLLERLCESLPRYRRWAFRMNIKCSDSEFYRFALAELGGQPDDLEVVELRERLVALTAKLQKGSDGFLLIFDEAQNLSDSVLSELANLVERSPAKPQIILSGQPALAEMLRSPQHSRLRNCVAGEHTLSRLAGQEVVMYITQRLCIAGYPGSVFSDEAIKLIAEASHGVPRVINNICWAVMSTKAAHPFASEDIERVLNTLNLSPGEEGPIPSLGLGGPQALSTPVPIQDSPPMKATEALQSWLRNLVRWKGTAGELLVELSQAQGAGTAVQVSPRELLHQLASDRDALLAKGVALDIKTREGLPPLISLQFDPARIRTPEKLSQVNESASPPLPQPLAAEPEPSRRSRWRTIHFWTFGMVLIAAAVAFTVRASEESVAPLQPIRPVPVSSDALAASDPIASERSAAESGDPESQRRLALRYQRGDGVAQDNAEALKWLRRAAGNRDPESQYLLALALAGTDKLEAYKWFVLSHSAGWQQSLPEIERLTPQLDRAEIGRVRYELSLAYANGEGVSVDLSQAYIWMTLAKAAGFPDSDEQLQRIARRMSTEEIASASHKADAWLARIGEPLTR
jgi:general secretion pathway protein A